MITSTSNPTIKQIRKLRERKERLSSGLFYAEGLRIVAEALQYELAVETLVVAPELLISDFGTQLVNEQLKKGTSVLEVSAQVFESFALKDGPQGLALVAHQKWSPVESIRVQPGEHWVALDSVADPGNLGTILRTHDGVGGRGIIILDQSTDPYDPTAIRASMGAVFSQQLVKVKFEEFADWKQHSGLPVFGTSGAASADYTQVSYPAALALLMGSERHGLLDHHLKLCDQVVSIPMIGRSDSLNLAVATAVVLYEIFNQQRRQK